MSLTPADMAFLARAPLMERFTPQELEVFASYLDPKVYQAGQVMIWEKTPQRSLSLLVTGVAVVSKTIRGEVESVLARLTTGDHFGELSLLDEEPASCNVTAEEECRVLIIEYSELERLFQEESALFAKLTWAMLKDLAQKLRATNRKVQEAVEWGLDAASLDHW